MTSPVSLFPTSGALPEDRQIGRGGAIKALQTQVVGDGHHSWLVSERRTGKSSVARAVLDRTRGDGNWALAIDLKYGATTSSQFAAALARAAEEAGVAITSKGEKAKKLARSGVDTAGKLASLAARLGLNEGAGAEEVSTTVGDILGPEPPDDLTLERVLDAIQTAALTEEQRVCLFIDELQELSRWPDQEEALKVEQQISKLTRQTDSPVVLILAGSDGDAIAQLRDRSRPLHYDGIDYELPAIADEDWVAGIRDRFAQIQTTISREQVLDILEESGGHPLRTMAVCAHLKQLAGNDANVSDALVIEAITKAKKQPSWNS